jgi:hypothetical protein
MRELGEVVEEWLKKMDCTKLLDMVKEVSMPSELLSIVLEDFGNSRGMGEALAKNTNISEVDLVKLSKHKDEKVACIAKENLEFRKSPIINCRHCGTKMSGDCKVSRSNCPKTSQTLYFCSEDCILWHYNATYVKLDSIEYKDITRL